MSFDWNSSAEFKNEHQRSHVTPLIGVFLPPTAQKIQIPPILMKVNPYVLAINKEDSHNFSFFQLL